MDGYVGCPGLHCGAWDALRAVLRGRVCGMLCGAGDALGLLLCGGMFEVLVCTGVHGMAMWLCCVEGYGVLWVAALGCSGGRAV